MSEKLVSRDEIQSLEVEISNLHTALEGKVRAPPTPPPLAPLLWRERCRGTCQGINSRNRADIFGRRFSVPVDDEHKAIVDPCCGDGCVVASCANPHMRSASPPEPPPPARAPTCPRAPRLARAPRFAGVLTVRSIARSLPHLVVRLLLLFLLDVRRGSPHRVHQGRPQPGEMRRRPAPDASRAPRKRVEVRAVTRTARARRRARRRSATPTSPRSPARSSSA